MNEGKATVTAMTENGLTVEFTVIVGEDIYDDPSSEDSSSEIHRILIPLLRDRSQATAIHLQQIPTIPTHRTPLHRVLRQTAVRLLHRPPIPETVIQAQAAIRIRELRQLLLQECFSRRQL